MLDLEVTTHTVLRLRVRSPSSIMATSAFSPGCRVGGACADQ